MSEAFTWDLALAEMIIIRPSIMLMSNITLFFGLNQVFTESSVNEKLVVMLGLI